MLLSQQEFGWGRSTRTPEIPADSENLSLHGLIEALFRHKGVFTRVFTTVIGLTILVTTVMPRAFESRMKILVENARKNVSITPEKTERVITNDAVTEEEINSEVELIDSNDLMEAVSQKLDGAPSDPARLEAAVASLQKRLKINPVRKSNVIEVEYLDRSPQRATRVLQLLSAEYLNKHLQLQRPIGAFEFFRDEADRYRQQLEQAEQELADFEKSKNFVGLAEEKDALMKQINQADDDIRTSNAVVQEINQRLKTNASLAHNIAPRIATQTRVMPNQMAAQTLTTLLVDLKNRRTSMLTKFRPEDRLIKDLDEQIAFTSQSLENVSKGSATETTSDVNTVWQELNAERAKDEIARNGQSARRAALQREMQASQVELADLQTLTVQYDALSRRVQELDTNYKTFAQKRDEAQIADAMDRQKLLNVAIAEPPTLSTLSAAPACSPVASDVSAEVIGLVEAVETALNVLLQPAVNPKHADRNRIKTILLW